MCLWSSPKVYVDIANYVHFLVTYKLLRGFASTHILLFWRALLLLLLVGIAFESGLLDHPLQIRGFRVP